MALCIVGFGLRRCGVKQVPVTVATKPSFTRLRTSFSPSATRTVSAALSVASERRLRNVYITYLLPVGCEGTGPSHQFVALPPGQSGVDITETCGEAESDMTTRMLVHPPTRSSLSGPIFADFVRQSESF
jgi:hypothetical protein